MWQIGSGQGSGSFTGSITTFSHIPQRFVTWRSEPCYLSSLSLLLRLTVPFFFFLSKFFCDGTRPHRL